MGNLDRYHSRDGTISGVPIRVTTYRVGETWHAVVANVDPGANVARASAASLDEAFTLVMEKARRRIRST